MITMILAVVAVAVFLIPGAEARLQFDLVAVEAGQWWRLVTGHLTHFGGEHLLWDLAVFVALGLICERIDRGRFLACLAFSAGAISLVILGGATGHETYRGLSGIDSALFALAAVMVGRRRWEAGDRFAVLMVAAALAGFVVKVAYETVTGATLFVDSTGAGFVPVPLAHAVGAAIGASLGLAFPCWRREPSFSG